MKTFMKKHLFGAKTTYIEVVREEKVNICAKKDNSENTIWTPYVFSATCITQPATP